MAIRKAQNSCSPDGSVIASSRLHPVPWPVKKTGCHGLGEKMSPSAAGLLRGHPLLRSRDPEELGAYLHAWGYQLLVGRQAARQLDACFNGVFLPNLTLGYYHYGAPVEVRTSPTNDNHWILWPLRGQSEMITGRVAVTCGPGRAMVVSPTQTSFFRSQGGARLHLRLNGAGLLRRLVALLGEPLDRPLEFAPEMILNEGYGRGLSAYLRLAIADLEQTGSILGSPITVNSFEEFIMTGLLLSHPHNCSGMLLRRQKPVAPRDVRRAIDYIEANLDAAIGLPEIVAAAGVPGRTLIQHFRDFKGTSPMRYLRRARYRKVREALRDAEPEEHITEIAAKWGFTHMGRFSVDYRRQFGETPSQTLRRARTTRPSAMLPSSD